MKIKNKYSKKRYSFKEKLQIKFSKIIIDSCIRFPKSSLSKYLLYKSESYKVDINENDYIDFVSMFVIDIVQKEDFYKAQKGFRRMLNNYKPYSSFNFNDSNRADNFFANKIEDYGGKSWHNLGCIEFEKGSFIRKYVSIVEITALTFSPSLVCFSFNIHPTKLLKEEFNNILNEDTKERKLLIWPNLRTLKSIIRVKHWGYSSRSVEQEKEEAIRDLMLEIKYNVLKRVSKYLPIYIFKENTVVPSLEVYKTNIYHNRKEYINLWRTLGISTYYSDLSRNGELGLFYKDKSDDVDCEFKLLGNVRSMPEIYRDEESYLNSIAEEIIAELYQGLVMNALLNNFKKKFSRLRNKTFRILSKRFESYYKLMRLKFKIENEFKMLFRVVTEMDSKMIELSLRNYSDEFISNSNRLKGTFYEHFIKYILSEIKLVNKNTVDTRKILDEYINMNSMKTNYRISITNMLLSTITVIVSTLSVIIGLITLEITLPINTSNELILKLNTIIKYLVHFISR